jgi:hypothetical protein
MLVLSLKLSYTSILQRLPIIKLLLGFSNLLPFSIKKHRIYVVGIAFVNSVITLSFAGVVSVCTCFAFGKVNANKK